jgi:transposase
LFFVTLRSEAPAVAFFRYSPDRRAERPFEHLRNFGGIPQADAYAVSIGAG